MNKRFDTFSFKAPSSSQPSIASRQQIAPIPRQINYRHTSQMTSHPTALFDYNINSKIANIDRELDQNIKRRLQLEQQLNIVKSQERQQLQRDVFMGYNHHLYKNQEQTAKQFSKMQQRVDRVDELVKRETNRDIGDKNRQLDRNKQILLTDISSIPTTKKEQIIIPILQHFDYSHKPPKVYTVPDQIKIQQLLRKVTFPQVPVGNLSNIRKQIETLFAVHSPHSDIHYLLMVIYFHLGEHAKVRRHYEQILNFKIYNTRAHWIAAQAQFALGNYDLCLRLTEECIELIEEKYLPRFIFLKARSYEQIGNYINCVVCYGQLIKLKPKIGEYYLQRGVVYHRMGYYKEAKQDFVTFGLLKPQAEQLLKDKILSQKNEHRKKELIGVLAKMF